jgi:hypothetical protein
MSILHRIEIPHPDKGHVVQTWADDDTRSETEIRKVFEELIAEGWGAATEDENGTEHYTRKWRSAHKSPIIRMIPRFAGG